MMKGNYFSFFFKTITQLDLDIIIKVYNLTRTIFLAKHNGVGKYHVLCNSELL